MGSPSGPLFGNILSGLATKNIDMKGRRVVGASDAQDVQDYVTLTDLTNAIKGIVFPDTSNNQLVITSYTQATLPSRGLYKSQLVYITDFNHLLIWNGSAWQWGPGETGSGQLQHFAVAPTGNGWHVCDGSSVTYLKSDGTTGTITLPNSSGAAAYLKASSSYNATPNSAQIPTVSQPTFTGNVLTQHSHTLPFGADAGSMYVAAGTLGSITAVGKWAYAASSGTQGTVFLPSGSTSGGTPSGTVSQPTASLPGDPVDNYSVLLYFRR